MTQPIVGKPINQLAQWDEQRAFKNSRPRIYRVKFGQMRKNYKCILSISLSIYIHLIYHISTIHPSFWHVFPEISWHPYDASPEMAGAGEANASLQRSAGDAVLCQGAPGRGQQTWRNRWNMMELEEDIEWHRNMVEHMVKMMVMDGYGRINFLWNTLAILTDCEWGLRWAKICRAQIRRRLASQVLLILTACTWDEGVALHSGSHHGRGSLTSFSHHYHWIFRMEIHFYSLWICIMIIFITTGHKCYVSCVGGGYCVTPEDGELESEKKVVEELRFALWVG